MHHNLRLPSRTAVARFVRSDIELTTRRREKRVLLLSPYMVDRRELVTLTGLLLIYIAIWLGSPSNYLANTLGPAAMLAVLTLGAWRQLRREPRAIWTPIFWFRVSTSVYFGIGQIAPFLANDVTLMQIRSLYAFSEDELFKAGLINICSVLTVLTTAAALERTDLFRKQTRQPAVTAALSHTSFYALVFLVAGGIAKYFVVLPGALGLAEPPLGIVHPLAKSYTLGLFLLALLALRGRRTAWLALAVLTPIDIAVGFLTFAKTEVMLTMMLVFLAVLHHRTTIWRIIFGGILIVGVFSQLDPYIFYGRKEIHRLYKDAGVPLDRRLAIISQFSQRNSVYRINAEQQDALNRVSYVGAASMVISYYDSGIPGSSLSDAFIVFIPRTIWPEKPEITRLGKDLYLQATSQDGSSISPGLFAEAYWNFGWIGIPLLMAPLGAILYLFSNYSLAVMRREGWPHLPVVFMGILAGVRVDGWYVADVIGGGSMALVLAVLIGLVERFNGQPATGRRLA